MANTMPDILITDIKMPVVSGIELIERAKGMNQLIQCIVLSGFDEFDLAQSVMEKGVRHYLLKPCTKDKVESAVNECITQLEIDKKRSILNEKSRKRIIDRIIAELLDLASEKSDITIEKIQNIMSTYSDSQIWKECAVTLVLMYWAQIDSQIAVKQIQDIYDDQNACFAYVQQTLLKMVESGNNEESYLDKIKKYVDDNYPNSWLTIKQVAENVVYMNAQYIGKQFYKKMGVTFSQYLLSVRMEHAKQLLLDQEQIKMFEIAERIGLGHNIQYFFYLFKRYCGMTPKEYQKHLKS